MTRENEMKRQCCTVGLEVLFLKLRVIGNKAENCYNHIIYTKSSRHFLQASVNLGKTSVSPTGLNPNSSRPSVSSYDDVMFLFRGTRTIR